MSLRNFILLFIILPALSFAQTYESKPKYAPRNEHHRNAQDAKGKQGLWKFFTVNKDLFMEINYENDIKNGPCTRYYTSTGGPREELNYYYGVKDGEYKSYNVSGATKSEGQFKKNRRDGHWVFYYASTAEKSTEGDYVTGKKDGEWIYYNRKGEMSCKGNYKNDIKTGVWHYYDSEGNEIKSENIGGSLAEKKETGTKQGLKAPKLISRNSKSKKTAAPPADNSSNANKPKISFDSPKTATTKQPPIVTKFVTKPTINITPNKDAAELKTDTNNVSTTPK